MRVGMLVVVICLELVPSYSSLGSHHLLLCTYRSLVALETVG